MTVTEITLDDSKVKRYIAQPVWIRQDDSQDTIKVTLDEGLTITTDSVFEFDCTKFDEQVIQDKEQSNFEIFNDILGKPIGFTYKLPAEIYQSSGSTTATYFRIDGSSTSNFIIYVQRADGVGGTESNSLISDAKSVVNEISSVYQTIQETAKNTELDTEDIRKQIDDLDSKLADITKLIDDNNVIKKTEAQEVITGIVNEMDLNTDDKISDPDVLAKIQTLGAV